MNTTTNTARNLSTTAEKTAQIRAELKAAGIPARHVSVRKIHHGSIVVEIKSADVPFSVVEAAANKHEKIDRDGFGEILAGGNTYVTVRYVDAVVEGLAAGLVMGASKCYTFQGREIALVDDDTFYVDAPGLRSQRFYRLADAVHGCLKAGSLADRILELAAGEA